LNDRALTPNSDEFL